MKIPKRIQPLIDEGLIDEVISRLMSGKEADVYVVRSNNEVRCAKVYKEAANRGFKQAVLYREGRKGRNSRRSRAMDKGSKFGRQQQEETWHNAEVDALRKLAKAGVRVPEPYACIDGVLLMELVTDFEGLVAPRLSDIDMTAEEALDGHAKVMRFVVQMLCEGLVHGDLSEFNILVDEDGPVICDFKTSARSSSPMEISHEIQLGAYAYLFRQATGQKEAGLEIRSLVKTKTPKIEYHRFAARSEPHLGRLFAVIREYLDALDRGRFNYRPGWGCSMRDFKDSHCRRWAG
jgi:serine/threonine-protein kinase RIO1